MVFLVTPSLLAMLFPLVESVYKVGVGGLWPVSSSSRLMMWVRSVVAVPSAYSSASADDSAMVACVLDVVDSVQPW